VAELESPYILIYEKKLSGLQLALPIFDRCFLLGLLA
jgi:hypothetical protein